MPKKILIDAVHPEETRVVLLEDGRIQELDTETALKAQVKGNIYLAKVTRVEASLQAAFIEYGGNKHGFLPFSEIHPDYYNIPIDDKRKLMQSLREAENEHITEDDIPEEDEQEEAPKPKRKRKGKKSTAAEEKEAEKNEDADPQEETAEFISSDEAEEVKASMFKTTKLHKRYSIQEVIKRNQIILVQVEKEERGNKGASLTTFISLAGKYCVLMPNSLRQGGVSRRIANSEHRRQLKKTIRELKIPEEIGIIVRTAGAGRPAKDIKADYDYLVGLWNEIRELTLSSDAPAFIHAEGDVIKRTVRDLFHDDVDELLVEGKAAYDAAKKVMKTIMPGRVARVKHYQHKVPIFSRHKVEEQIAELYGVEASLESGGSIVLNPTEALISIDVNSGKSTSKRNVEETALATNLEAAYEIARQLKLRDMSGLIVVDFIDMLELRNKKSVERALKEAFKNDKARVQIGRISHFGLLEMSRQRLHPNFYEINTVNCPHCAGTGKVKSATTIAVAVLKAIEAELNRAEDNTLNVYVAMDVALYMLNNKRDKISSLEETHGCRVIVHQDAELTAGAFALEFSHDDTLGEFTQKHPSNSNKPEKEPKEEAKKEDQPAKQAKGKKHQKKGMFEGIWKKIID